MGTAQAVPLIFAMRYFSLFILLICCSQAYAQRNYQSDSVLWSIAGEQKMQYLFGHSTLLQDTARQNFGDLTIYYDLKNRNYRTSQQAQKTAVAAFEARGVNYLSDKIIVSGTFSYAKIWEDSLTYFLGGLDDNRIPGYYYTPKAGKFERQTYDAQAHLGYKINSPWQADLQANYTHHWSTRSVDPRMELYSMKFLLKPSLSYVSSNQQHFSLSGIWGYGRGQTDISYKNRKLNDGTALPEYHHFTSFGYGYTKELDSTALRQYDQYRGLELAGTWNQPSWTLYWSTSYLKRNNENTNDVRHRQHYQIKQTFNLDQIDLDLLFTDKRVNSNLLRFNLKTTNGHDGVYHRGKNYFLSQWNMALLYSKTFASGSSSRKEAGISVQGAYDKRDDALTEHLAVRRWIDVTVPLSWSKTGKSADRFRVQLSPSYRFALTNRLEVPDSQINAFTKGIAYPEFYYYDVDVFAIQTKLSYLTARIVKKTKMAFFVDFRFESAASSKQIVVGSQAFRGQNTNWRMGVNFYL